MKFWSPFTEKLSHRDLAFEASLKRALEGEEYFDDFTRGSYATDASLYRISSKDVVFPRHESDLSAALNISVDPKVPLIARGAEQVADPNSRLETDKKRDGVRLNQVGIPKSACS